MLAAQQDSQLLWRLEYELCHVNSDSGFPYAVVIAKTIGTSDFRRLVISLLRVVPIFTTLPGLSLGHSLFKDSTLVCLVSCSVD